MSSRLEERKREITLLGLDPDEYDFGPEKDSVGLVGVLPAPAEGFILYGGLLLGFFWLAKKIAK